MKAFFEPQPAHLMYAFDGGWKVMKDVSTNVFVRTSDAAKTWFDYANDWRSKSSIEQNRLFKYWQTCMVIGFFVAGLSQYLSAMLLVTVFVLLQFILLITWASISAVIMILLTLFNLLYSYYHRIFVRCPSCYEQMQIPVFVCPKCGIDHTRLWPSAYGIFYHRCATCNTKLATLDILGRRDLVCKCAMCTRPMNKRVGALINVHVPVIGGPSAGKSNYINMATYQLINNYAAPRGYEVSFPDEKDKEQYERNLTSLSSGRELAKTADITPQAYNMEFKKPNDRIGRIIYLYDAAGEAYSTEDDTALQKYYDYVDGLIFVIDPFSIESFRQKHENEVESIKNTLRPSTLSTMSAYERMITVLESSVGLSRNRKFRHPIAVVITKSDALNLESKVGISAVKELMHSDLSIATETDAGHELAKQFLIENDLGNLVRDLYSQFENIHFFSCAALGRLPDTNNHDSFKPVGVLEPLVWILSVLKIVNEGKERSDRVDVKHREMARARSNFVASAKFFYWDSLKPRQW